MENFELSELTRSQLPALHLLQNLGYTYLSPREALALLYDVREQARNALGNGGNLPL